MTERTPSATTSVPRRVTPPARVTVVASPAKTDATLSPRSTGIPAHSTPAASRAWTSLPRSQVVVAVVQDGQLVGGRPRHPLEQAAIDAETAPPRRRPAVRSSTRTPIP